METTELEKAQQRAMDAMDAAKTSSDNAAMAAKDAMDAGTNLATEQTDAMSGMLAYEASKYAKMAMDEYDKAVAANDDAMAATTISAAVEAAVDAENARDAAMSHEMTADEKGMAAEEAAKMELMIVDKTKMVGDTSITIDGQSRETTVDDETSITGLLKDMDITTPGMMTVNGLPIVDDDGEDIGDRMAGAVDVGFTYDSSDDSARVTLVHSYLGTGKQMQFLRSDDTSPFDGSSGALDVDAPASSGEDLTPNTADDDDITNGAVTIPANASHNTEPVTAVPKAAGSSFRAVDATDDTRTTLYYVKSGVADTTTGDTDDGIDQTRIFLERDSAGGVVTYNVVNVIEVTIDAASAFEHLHYGLWNGISGDGDNEVSDLGIGFVTALPDGMGMTEVMPNIGSATYNGNYVANVQRADPEGDGDITRRAGTSSMVANFTKQEVDVTLSGLVTLEGMIAENTFLGEKATIIDTVMDDSNTPTSLGIQNDSGLGVTGKFTGSFEGAFYGPLGAEAGGVFDFASEDNEDGAFTGSFGGARD
jgi:hypothetical protein